MVSSAPVPIISSRPLGIGEWFWWQMSKARSVNFVTLARLSGQVDAARIQQSIAYVQQRYPILRSRIVSSGARPQLEVLTHVNVPFSVVPRQSADQHMQLAQQEISDSITADSCPLWRVSLVHGATQSELLLTFHHCMSDGLSSVQIMQDMLLFHAGQHSTEPEQIVLPPAYDDLLPKSSLWQTMRHYWPAIRRLIKPPALAQLPQRPAIISGTLPHQPDTTASFVDAYSQVLVYELNAEKTKQLLTHCKTLNSSVNDVLSGALLKSVAPELTGKQQQLVSMTSAINIRPLLPPSYHQVVGYYSSGIESRFLLSTDSDLLTLGKQATQMAKSQFNVLNIQFGLWLRSVLIRLRPNPTDLLSTLMKGSRANIHLSNMGRLAMQKQFGDLTVDAAFPIAGVHYAHKPLFCMVTVSFDQRLFLIASFCQPMTGLDHAQQLFDRYCALIEQWSASPIAQLA
jgi:NRPS condensation-like uncharacterized protein